ncbi:MAG TPA: hypothetical protein H9662_09960 [Firmicutes bacterium]|nr:hypothetical protein [Bacillota bacterium]
MDSKNKNALLALAAKKLGTTPEKLMNDIQNGKYNHLQQTADPNLLRTLKNNPKALEALLQGQSVDEIIKKIQRG